MADDAKVTAVRLLVNDPNPTAGPSITGQAPTRTPVFDDTEVEAFLAMEGGNVKRAAAQALDNIADDQALTLKAANDRGLTLDGPKVADSLRKRAAALRAQADREQADEDDAADDGYFDVVHLG